MNSEEKIMAVDLPDNWSGHEKGRPINAPPLVDFRAGQALEGRTAVFPKAQSQRCRHAGTAVHGHFSGESGVGMASTWAGLRRSITPKCLDSLVTGKIYIRKGGKNGENFFSTGRTRVQIFFYGRARSYISVEKRHKNEDVGMVGSWTPSVMSLWWYTRVPWAPFYMSGSVPGRTAMLKNAGCRGCRCGGTPVLLLQQ